MHHHYAVAEPTKKNAYSVIAKATPVKDHKRVKTSGDIHVGNIRKIAGYVASIASTIRHMFGKISGRLVLYGNIVVWSIVFILGFSESYKDISRGTYKSTEVVHVLGYEVGFIYVSIVALGTVIWAFASLASRKPIMLKDLPEKFRVIGTLIDQQRDLDVHLAGITGALWSVAGVIATFMLGAPASSTAPFDKMVNQVTSQCSSLVYLLLAVPILLSLVAWWSQTEMVASASALLEEGWNDLADLEHKTTEEVARIESTTLRSSMRKIIIKSLNLRKRRYTHKVSQLRGCDGGLLRASSVEHRIGVST